MADFNHPRMHQTATCQLGPNHQLVVGVNCPSIFRIQLVFIRCLEAAHEKRHFTHNFTK
jgi:hypothetical protein